MTTSQNVKFENVRISFPEIASPKVFKDKETGQETCSLYQVTILIPKVTSKIFEEFVKKANESAMAEWKESYPVRLKKAKLCYGDGDECISTKTLKVYKGYEEHYYIRCSSYFAPVIIDRTGKAVQTEEERKKEAALFYGGCYVNIVLSPRASKIKTNKGEIRADSIGANLVAIQFAKDGEKLDGGVNINELESVFTPLESITSPTFGTILD